MMVFLQAAKAAGTTDSAAVIKIMKDTPINDMFAKNGRIRETATWCTTCTCSRSRNPRNPKAAGMTTSS